MMTVKQLQSRLDKLERRSRSGVWSPNLFIWCDNESVEQATARWESEHRPLGAGDRVCYIGWVSDGGACGQC